jgi:hypothetical protein
MSFAPILVMRPIDVPPPKFHKTVSERIQRYLRADILPNLVYSISEACSIRSAGVPPDIPPSFTSLNRELADGAKAADVAASLSTIDWPASLSTAPALNVFCLCFQFLEFTADQLAQLFDSLSKGFMSASGSLAKKLLLAILLVSARLTDLASIPDYHLEYAIPQDPVVSSGFDSVLTFRFLLGGQIPAAYLKGEQVTQKYTRHPDLLTYFTANKFTKASKFPVARALLNGFLPPFLKALTGCMQQSNRAQYPIVSRFDLGPAGESFPGDVERERDLTLLLGWSVTHVLWELFLKSNALDGELFRHFLLGVDGMSLAAVGFHSFAADIRPLLKPCDAAPFPGLPRKPLRPLTVALGTGLHVAADLIAYSPPLVAQYLTKKAVIGLPQICEVSGQKILVREAAYVLAKLLRFIKLDQQIPAKLVTFVYTNLEHIEMFGKLTPEFQNNVQPVQTQQEHIENLRKYAREIGIAGLFPD